jgi:hypothetical protein
MGCKRETGPQGKALDYKKFSSTSDTVAGRGNSTSGFASNLTVFLEPYAILNQT